MPNHINFAVVLAGLFGFAGFALLVLSVIELRKPSQTAKLIGFTWLFFAIAAGSISVFLLILEISFRLPNAHKQWVSFGIMVGSALFFLFLAFTMLMRAEVSEQRELAETARTTRPAEGVWPPPPAGP